MATQGNLGVGIATSQGLVQLLLPLQVAIRMRWLSSHTRAAEVTQAAFPFDEAEQKYTAEMRRNDGVVRSPSGVTGSLSMSVRGGFSGRTRSERRCTRRWQRATAGEDRRRATGAARTGRARNVHGVVIVEVTIDVDGTVKDARVLRSIPMLDAAALEAVRQWRYEPTTIDGKPVPVIMTVPVTF